MSTRPAATDIPHFYRSYVALVPEENIVSALEEQGRKTAALLRSVGDEKASFRYAPEKWSVKGVVGHFTDAERIFAYRALAIARGESKSLPGFDEKAYAVAADFDRRTFREMVDEYEAARRSTVALFRGLSDDAWKRSGVANEVTVSVRSLAYIMLGHERHHLGVLRDRYGV